MADADDAAYASSSSASSENTVLISKPLQQRHRKRLREQLQGDKGKSPSRPSHESHTPTTTPRAAGKADHILCAVCEREGEGLYVCTGSCVSAFHLACLEGASASPPAARDQWMCPSCASNTHHCFHCKRLGLVEGATTTTTTTNEVASAVGADPSPSGSGDATAADMRPVVKCRALSCGKYYHQDCIAKLPLARIAGARFICPLHTCAACEQSGAKKEPVRCTRCPVAYHTSCLPPQGVVNLPGKRIICPRHEHESGVAARQAEIVETAADTRLPALQRVASVDGDATASIAASSPRTDDNDDARSDTSTIGTRKHSKKDKKDKKKKKKKRKKVKKKEREHGAAISVSSPRGDDDEQVEGDDTRDKRPTKKAKLQSAKADEGSVDRHREEGAGPEPAETATSTANALPTANEADHDEGSFKRAESGEHELENKAPVKSEADDAQQTSSVLSTAEKMKAKLLDVLGPSDDDAASQRSTPVRSNSVSMEAHNDLEDGEEVEDGEVSPKGSGLEISSEPQGEMLQAATTPPKTDDDVAVLKSVSSPGMHDPSSAATEKDANTAEQAVEGTHQHSETNPAESHRAYGNLSVEIPTRTPPDEAITKDVETLERDVADSMPTPKQRGLGSRTAAEVAKEKLSSGGSTPATSGTGSSSSRSKKSKKKKKASSKGGHSDVLLKKPSGDEADAEEGEDEAKWVQCDDCKKWRTVSRYIDLDSMPDRWYCHMNTWNPAVASCSVPEEVVEPRKSKGKAAAAAPTPPAQPEQTEKKKTKAQMKAQAETDARNSSGDAAGSGGEKDKDRSGSTTSKSSKKGEKDSKKRKLKLKLKEKYGEVKWVQCEGPSCGKWRVVPPSIDFDLLPATWFCNLNHWSPELANCHIPNPADVEAFLQKSQSKKQPNAAGPKPAKRPKGEPPVNADATGQSNNHDGAKSNDKKSSKSTAKSSTPTAVGPGAASGPASGPGHSGNTINAGGANSVTGPAADTRANKILLEGAKNAVVLEWAQCEKCNKWRKLPAHIKSSTLPDKWYCSMNHWDPTRASCSAPQEEDQEPVEASPLPSSQNWYPMPGQVGGPGGATAGGVGGFRSKRGKLSYSELLYASTGQLRKTYTSESSTLSFEYEGIVYHRDDQYQSSSMYISPLTTNKLTGEPIDASVSSSSDSVRTQGIGAELALVDDATQRLVDRIARVIVTSMGLREAHAITEIVDTVMGHPELNPTGNLSLSAVTTALAQLVSRGEVQKVDCRLLPQPSSTITENGRDEPASKKRKTTASGLLEALSSPAFYRKVPQRPLKALKAWKHATIVME